MSDVNIKADNLRETRDFFVLLTDKNTVLGPYVVPGASLAH